MRPRVAVIGGGISGLSAAYELANGESAVDVLLLESGSRLGGVLETQHCDGFLIEAAADNFLTTPPAAVDLCRALGIDDGLISTNSQHRQTFVIRRGRLQPIPLGFLVMAPSRIRPMLRTRVLSARGKLRVGLECLVPRRTSHDDESLASFVRRRFGREMFERLVQPLVGGIYTADPERLSIDATMPRFREMEREHGSLIRATLRQRRMHAAENCCGARYGQFAALRRGMSTLVNALAERLPHGSVRLAAPVDAIEPLVDGGWFVLVGGAHPHRLKVDGVILATPAHRTASILATLDSAAANNLAQIEYASCAVISLGYRRDQIRHPLNGFGLVVPLVEQRSVLSCSFSSVKYEARAPEDSVLLRVYMGGVCQSGLLHLPDDQLVQLAEREVADLLQIRGEPVIRHLTRQRRAMPQYHVGHRDLVAKINERLTRFSTLALAGSAYGGVGVPACIQSGKDAAERVLSRLTKPITGAKNVPSSTDGESERPALGPAEELDRVMFVRGRPSSGDTCAESLTGCAVQRASTEI
jgi:oxygen-dependent protoporphyrinogen oxidase